VERGETLVVLRHGRPIAEVSPVTASAAAPSWKKPALRLVVKGAGLSRAILAERDDENLR
jgi:antitoxin (DNA-binding transcriptional repressor) of toxin-antitoxin stability system